MRHFGSLVLALILAPVVWVAIAFGTNRLARSIQDLSSSPDTDRYLGIGLLLVAAVALGVLLVPRFSPVGPVLAGVGFLAVSVLGLSVTSPVYDLGKDVLSTEDQQILVTPIPTGYLWLAGFALLLPLFVPARWKKSRPAAVAPAAAAGYGPHSPGLNGPNAPGPNGPGSSGPGPNAPGAYSPGGYSGGYGSGGYDPGGYQPGGYGSTPAAPTSGSPGSSGPPTTVAPPVGSDSGPGQGDYSATPGWDGPPPGSPAPYPTTPYPGSTNYPPSTYGSNPSDANYPDYGGRPAQSPGSAHFPSASPYPGSAGTQYPSSAYSSTPDDPPAPSTYQAQTYPATYSSPEQPGPTSYAPTVYGRNRPDDTDETRQAAAPRDDDNPQETRRLP